MAKEVKRKVTYGSAYISHFNPDLLAGTRQRRLERCSRSLLRRRFSLVCKTMA